MLPFHGIAYAETQDDVLKAADTKGFTDHAILSHEVSHLVAVQFTAVGHPIPNEDRLDHMVVLRNKELKMVVIALIDKDGNEFGAAALSQDDFAKLTGEIVT